MSWCMSFLSCLWRPFTWRDFKIAMKSFLVQTKLENKWPHPHFIIIAQPESSGKSRSNTGLTMKIAWLSIFKGPLFEDPKWRFWTLNKSIWQLKPPRHSVAKIIPATHCTKLIKQKPAAAQCCSKHTFWSFCIYVMKQGHLEWHHPKETGVVGKMESWLTIHCYTQVQTGCIKEAAPFWNPVLKRGSWGGWRGLLYFDPRNLWSSENVSVDVFFSGKKESWEVSRSTTKNYSGSISFWWQKRSPALHILGCAFWSSQV